MLRYIVWPLTLILLVLMTMLVHAHDWYPVECCSNQDCAPVDKVEVIQPQVYASLLPGMPPRKPQTIVTTKHGSAIIPDNLQRRQSPDGQMHACIRGGQLLCIFMPPSM